MKMVLLFGALCLSGCSAFRGPETVPYVHLDGRYERVPVKLLNNDKGAKVVACFDRNDGAVLCLLVKGRTAYWYTVKP